MRRVTDPSELNAVINHPAVRTVFGFPDLGNLDCGPMLADERNWCLANGATLLWFTWRGPGVYEVHCVVGPKDRGAKAVRAATDMLIHMRDVCGANLLWCEFDAARRDVAAFARAVGFRTLGISNGKRLMEVR